MNVLETLTQKRLSLIGDEDEKYLLAADASYQKELYQLLTTPTIEATQGILRSALLVINSLSYCKTFDIDGSFQRFMIQYIEKHAENEDQTFVRERDELFKLMLLSLTKLRIKDELVTQTFKDYLNYKFIATRDEEVIQLIIRYLIKLTNPNRSDSHVGHMEFFPHLLHHYSKALLKDLKYSSDILYLMDIYIENHFYEGSEYIQQFSRVIKPLKKRIMNKKSLLAISNYVNYTIKRHRTKKVGEVQIKFLKLWILPVILNDKDIFNKKSISKINPISILTKISLNFPTLNQSLIETDIIRKFIDYLKKVNVKSYGSLSEKSVQASVIEMNVASIFMIFSSIASNDDTNRDSIIGSNDRIVLSIIEDILKSYTSLKEMIRCSPQQQTQMRRLDHELALSALYLLRSLSRSIASLRKYLIDLKIPSTLIDLVRPPSFNSPGKEPETDSMDVDDETDDFAANTKDENLIISLTLSILSNLILEFSPIRQKFLDLDLIPIIRLYLGKGADPLSSINFSIKLNSLWVLRHLVYNEKLKFKEGLIIDQISLPVIFAYIKDDAEIDLQEQSLNILRNLTSNCNKSQIYKILQFYQYLQTEEVLEVEKLNQDCLFFKLLIGKLQKESSTSKHMQCKETVIYTFAHILKSNEKFRNLLIENTELLEIMKSILVSKETPDTLKTAVIWFLINLTWLDNSRAHRLSNPVSDEDMEDEDQQTHNADTAAMRRIHILKGMGFTDSLKELLVDIENNLNNPTPRLNVDLKDRVKTVLSNLDTSI